MIRLDYPCLHRQFINTLVSTYIQIVSSILTRTAPRIFALPPVALPSPSSTLSLRKSCCHWSRRDSDWGWPRPGATACCYSGALLSHSAPCPLLGGLRDSQPRAARTTSRSPRSSGNCSSASPCRSAQPTPRCRIPRPLANFIELLNQSAVSSDYMISDIPNYFYLRRKIWSDDLFLLGDPPQIDPCGSGAGHHTPGGGEGHSL